MSTPPNQLNIQDPQFWLLIAQIALTAAGAVPGVNPKTLGYIQTGLNATAAGLAGVREAQAGVDPSKLKPIEPIV